MGKNKLKQWAEMKTFERVFQPDINFHQTDHSLKGSWKRDVFKNSFPVVAELGCGKGEYTVNLAQRYPKKNFIGVDIKGARMWRGAKTANENNMLNVAFLRTRIEFIEKFFSENELSEIWLTFPDPQPRQSKENKRLSSPFFLEKYRRILADKGLLHLKTDSEELFDFTINTLKTLPGEMLSSTNDLYGVHNNAIDLDIETTYEKIFRQQGKKICYLQFLFFK